MNNVLAAKINQAIQDAGSERQKLSPRENTRRGLAIFGCAFAGPLARQGGEGGGEILHNMHQRFLAHNHIALRQPWWQALYIHIIVREGMQAQVNVGVGFQRLQQVQLGFGFHLRSRTAFSALIEKHLNRRIGGKKNGES